MAGQRGEEDGFDGGSWFVSDANRNFPNPSARNRKADSARLDFHVIRSIILSSTHIAAQQVQHSKDAAIESTDSDLCCTSIHPSPIIIVIVFIKCCNCRLSSILRRKSPRARAKTRSTESPNPRRTRSPVRRPAPVECPRSQSSEFD